MRLPVLFILSFLLVQYSLLTAQESTQNIPRDTSYTVYQSLIKARKHYPYAEPAKALLPAGVIADRDLVYTMLNDSINKNRKLHLDVFRPEKAGPYPALIMVHGGGWQSGNRSMQMPLAIQIATHGYVTVTVEYQLSPEALYPAAVYNIKSAIRWMRANAAKYAIDTGRIAISGCSAGGQLAALIGMTNGLENMEGNQGNMDYSSAVQAVIDVDGILDFLAPGSLDKTRKPHSADVSWLGGTFEEKSATWKEASAIFWVNRNSPPVLFLNSGFPRFHAGQDEMIALMNQMGIYSEVHQFDVQVHPFWLFHQIGRAHV